MKKSIFYSFFSRFLALFLSFGLIILSTNLWGSEGKGVISIVVANLTIIGFFTGIFSGGSVTYFSKKYSNAQLLNISYFFSLLIGIGSSIVYYYLNSEFNFFVLLSLIVSSSLYNTNMSLLVGRQKIGAFNLFFILQLLGQILFIVGYKYVLNISDVNIYFYSQILINFILVVGSAMLLDVNKNFKFSFFSTSFTKELFQYGWKTQLSAFVQFLNYRFSYYILNLLKGTSSVGIYSVGVAFSEAAWVVSRSLSIILYSEVVNSTCEKSAIQKTKTSMKLSFNITLFLLLLLFLVPNTLFSVVFGKDFQSTKEIIALLSPGILAIAVSNIIGHYFSGINELRILNIKSFVGLFITLALSFILIPKWGIFGACISTSLSYICSSSLLFWKFYKRTHFNWKDFMLTKNDILLLKKWTFERNK